MKLTIQELQRQIRKGPGLVFGPGLTTSHSREAQCLELLRSQFPPEPNTPTTKSFLEYADHLLAAGHVTTDKLRSAVIGHFTNTAFKNPQLESIVRAKWTAVISLCMDDFFRAQLSDFLYATPSKWTLTTVAERGTPVALTTVPYYSLCGDPRDSRSGATLGITRSDLMRRQRDWAALLQTLPNILKDDPLIFLGTGSISDRVCDFLNELTRLHPQIPNRLIFLADDQTPSQPTLKNLVQGLYRVETVDCTLKDISTYLSAQSLTIYSLPLFSDTTKTAVDTRALSEIEDQVAYVPTMAEVRANREERNRLLDSLFRPTHLEWAPYALKMQFKRDVCPVIAGRLVSALGCKTRAGRVIWIRGEAGIGKTVICRSVAFELASKGLLVFWIKRSYGELSGDRFDSLVGKLNSAIKRAETKVVFFLDNPTMSRISPAEVLNALNRARFAWSLAVCTRMTDRFNLSDDGSPSEDESQEILVPTEFTDNELSALPDYLVQLGVARSVQDASDRMIPRGFRFSKDVLCGLWYLLPQTHSAIEDSLVEEYRSLGQTEEIVQRFARAAGGARSIAKTAYELVTTTSGFDGMALPVEVLVSALGISYSEWTLHCREQKPLWGLLYDEEYPSAESYAYRTRNQIVTDVLLRALNQGTSGHTGEYRCLKLLLGSCTSSGPQYKQFIYDVLVARRQLVEKRFTLVQALELYDVAIGAYPRTLGVVEHQRAIVKRRLGGDAEEVYGDLRKLIARAGDRAIQDQDSLDNLHTSAAATLNQLIRDHRVDAATAGETVFQHISAALAIDQFSLHACHVHAKSLLTIAAELREVDRRAYLVNLERASRIASKGHSLLRHGSFRGEHDKSAHESKKLFEELRIDVAMAFSSLEDAERVAAAVFAENGDQSGLAYVARMLAEKAIQSGNGSAFKQSLDYLDSCHRLIQSRGASPSDELRVARLELLIVWRIEGGRGGVDWEIVRKDIETIVGNPVYSSDATWTFYLAVAEYNLGNFAEAEARFQLLRSQNLPWHIKNAVRCHYLGSGTALRVFEGRIVNGGRDRFVYSAELGTDVLVRRDEFQDRPDEVKHFTIGFSFYGPIALERGR